MDTMSSLVRNRGKGGDRRINEASEKLTRELQAANRCYNSGDIRGAHHHVTSALSYAIIVNERVFNDLRLVLLKLQNEMLFSRHR